MSNRYPNPRFFLDGENVWGPSLGGGWSGLEEGRALLPDGSGGYGYRIKVTRVAPGSGVLQIYGGTVPVTPGEEFKWGADVLVSDPMPDGAPGASPDTIGISSYFAESDGTFGSGLASPPTFEPSTIGTTRLTHTTTVAAGKMFARIYLQIRMYSASTVEVYVTNISAGQHEYADGDMPLWRWAGTPHLSEALFSPAARQVSDDIAPLLEGDEERGHAGQAIVTTATAPLELAAAVSLDPSAWHDPAAAPDELIGNQAMRRGLRGTAGNSVPRLRARLLNKDAAEVGATEAIAEAVRGVLTPAIPGATTFVEVRQNSDPSTFPAYEWGHVTVVTRPDESPAEAVITAAAELGAPDWEVIHAVIGLGESIDETTGTIDSRTTILDET